MVRGVRLSNACIEAGVVVQVPVQVGSDADAPNGLPLPWEERPDAGSSGAERRGGCRLGFPLESPRPMHTMALNMLA